MFGVSHPYEARFEVFLVPPRDALTEVLISSAWLDEDWGRLFAV